MKLKKEDIQNLKLAKKNYVKAYGKIKKRISYILDTIAKSFNNSIVEWCFWDTEDSDFLSCYDGKIIYNLIVTKENNDEEWIVDLGGEDGEITLSHAFPANWLFEDFEKELKESRTRFLEKEEKLLKAFSKKRETAEVLLKKIAECLNKEWESIEDLEGAINHLLKYTVD